MKRKFLQRKVFLEDFYEKLFSGDKYGKFVVIISDYHESWLQKCIKGDHQVRLGSFMLFKFFHMLCNSEEVAESKLAKGAGSDSILAKGASSIGSSTLVTFSTFSSFNSFSCASIVFSS